ncbi:MAG: cupin domain-containing protein [Thiohalocapsa sp.]|nr:cupin domain-containing protein [Thiohalocapsa sp.]MCF7990135.1 cupin domain-containing protein [Thiohalocapsa sp.]
MPASRSRPITLLPAALTALCLLQTAVADTAPAATAADAIPGQEVRLIHSPPEIMTRQRLPNFVGISAETAGARGLSMNLVIIPPGASAEPHYHKGFESAVYVLEGRVETRHGPGLKQSVITEAGDFLFIPPDVPHQPVNLSSTEAARAIVVRNDPNEQEHVILYDPSGNE